MRATSTVSVIVPAYQSAQTIGACLDSIATQTFPVSQILVIDDLSPDNTAQQVNAWNQTQSHPAQLIRQAYNGGPAAARNAGIAQATGNWIAFLDADDAWLPWRLETQMDVITDHPDAIMLCGQTADLRQTPADGTGVARPHPLQPEILKPETMLTHNPVATSTVLVRRDAILACNGFDTAFRGPEDYDLWLRLTPLGPCLYLPAILSRYRTTVGSLSMDDRTFLPEVLRVLDKAFAPGGALAAHQRHRQRAKAEQYTSASWMAYNRGDRMRAISLLLQSWRYGPHRLIKEQADPLQRIKLLLLYLRRKQLDT